MIFALLVALDFDNIVYWTLRIGILWNLNQNTTISIQKKCIWKCHLQNDERFVTAYLNWDYTCHNYACRLVWWNLPQLSAWWWRLPIELQKSAQPQPSEQSGILFEAPRWRESLEETKFINTLKPRQNGRHFSDDIFKYIFLNQNV